MMMCVLMLFFKIHDPLTKSLMFEARHALLHRLSLHRLSPQRQQTAAHKNLAQHTKAFRSA